MKRPALTFPRQVSEFVLEAYGSSQFILEYGSGGSTVVASEMLSKKILSVESDKSWAQDLFCYLETSSATKSMPKIMHIDIGPTQEWGHPKDFAHFRKFPKYPFACWYSLEFSPDVILIDGRFRVACFLASILFTNKPTLVLFDDYLDRPRYHCVEHFLKPSEMIDRMAVFHVKPGIPAKDLLMPAIEASLDPS